MSDVETTPTDPVDAEDEEVTEEEIPPEPRAVYPELDGEGGTVFVIPDTPEREALGTEYGSEKEARDAANDEAGGATTTTTSEEVAVEDETP